jgi:hypothetical protein
MAAAGPQSALPRRAATARCFFPAFSCRAPPAPDLCCNAAILTFNKAWMCYCIGNGDFYTAFFVA